MVLKWRLTAWIFCAGLVLTLSGCGDRSGAPGPWGGRIKRSGSRVELRGAVWRGFPEWPAWRLLADRPEIAVDGHIAVPGTPETAAFHCRMVRLAGMRYSFLLQSELNGVPMILRGETDLQKRTAALDIQCRLRPAQYAAWFGSAPKLVSGMADVKGSVLFSGGSIVPSFPLLSFAPVGDAAFRLGAFSLRRGRFDRRATFDGRTELESYGTTAQAGPAQLEFSRVIMDREQAEFQAQLTPPPDWQCTVRPRGTGTCELAGNGRWQFEAELPEPGVFRWQGVILPLRDLRVSGAGDAGGGTWEWSGDGASMTWQDPAFSGNGSEIRVAGHRDFRFDGGRPAGERRSFSLICKRFETSAGGGRIELERPRLELRRHPGGILGCRFGAENAVWNMKDGRVLRVKMPSGDLELLTAGNHPLSPEPGAFSAQSAELTGPGPEIRTGKLSGSLLLQERAWRLTAVPEKAEATFGTFGAVLPSPRLTLTGTPSAPERWTVAGAGEGGTLSTGVAGTTTTTTTVGFREWHGRMTLPDMFSPAEGPVLTLTGVEGRSDGEAVWSAAKIEAELREGPGAKSGRIGVSELSGKFAWGEVRRLSADVPFGRSDPAPGRIAAEKLAAGGLLLSGCKAEVRGSSGGRRIRGRAKDDRTGSVCFFTGDIPEDPSRGAVEYEIPQTTMLREMPADALLPLPGGWILSGKLGESGRFSWRGGRPEWRRRFSFSGFARNADCIAEDLVCDADSSGPENADARIRFRRLIAGRHAADDGEVRLRIRDKSASLEDAGFSAWGGKWRAHPDGGFAVKGIRLSHLLPLEGWRDAFSGAFSGSIRLNGSFAVQTAELTSDAAGVMKLSCLEPYRLLPKSGYSLLDLAFSEAAVRDFRYRSLKLKMIRRTRDVTLRISCEGRPSQEIPFVFSGGAWRRAERGEPGFAGDVELGCGYRIGERELGGSPDDDMRKVPK